MKKLLVFSLSLLSFGLVNAQSNTVTSGGTATGSGGSISFSVGQTNVSYDSSATGTVNQGVQQPYDISITVGLKEKNISLLAFPNPTKDELTISVLDIASHTYSYQLSDLNGKITHSGNLNVTRSTLDVKSLTAGVYLLKIEENNSTIKSYKIVKK